MTRALTDALIHSISKANTISGSEAAYQSLPLVEACPEPELRAQASKDIGITSFCVLSNHCVPKSTTTAQAGEIFKQIASLVVYRPISYMRLGSLHTQRG